MRIFAISYNRIKYMPIPEKPANEPSTVNVKLSGEVKRIVLDKKKQMRLAGFPSSNELAIQKLILGA